MAKTNTEVAKTNTEVANVEFANAAAVQTALASNKDALLLAAINELETYPDENFVSISGEYWKPVQGGKYTIVATGIVTIDMPVQGNNVPAGTTQEVECVTFAMKENGELKNYIFGGAVLVSAVKKEVEKDSNAGVSAGTFPMALRVAITGEAKSAAGKYLTMAVSRFFA